MGTLEKRNKTLYISANDFNHRLRRVVFTEYTELTILTLLVLIIGATDFSLANLNVIKPARLSARTPLPLWLKTRFNKV